LLSDLDEEEEECDMGGALHATQVTEEVRQK
jgi:hypothetical protein